ncbi:DUF1214 domain-containing protein [Nocardia sp. NPDC048505]|uniref:DUF1254 domain-containing protein n=1 Tax=unclassified Nocardia TaxID=2637762 RepID=UPI0033D50F44
MTENDASAAISTPDHVGTAWGDFRFEGGFPTPGSRAAAYAVLDRIHAIDAFIAGLPAVSQWALREGFAAAGVHDGDVLIFSDLMDCRSLFLTANADTVYFWTFLDLSDGPVAMDVPEGVLGVVDDMWWRWVADVGVPGADRGLGGRYVFVGPAYRGPLPEGGAFVHRVRTNRISLLGRAFLDNDDPAPAVARIRDQLRIGPYTPGGTGTSVALFLAGEAPLAAAGELPAPRFVEGSGLSMNTIYPNDVRFFDLLDAAIQNEPASALDPEVVAPIAAVGLGKDVTFAPDAERTALLADAAATANVLVRSVAMAPREAEGFAYYPGTGSQWTSPLFAGGYTFQTPPPQVTAAGVEPYPDRHAKLLNARSSFFYMATGITPAMCMNLPGIGSQYIATTVDATGAPLRGDRRYRLRLPAGIPAAKFWSITLYDNQTRSMLDTPQRFPRAGSQNYPTPAATAGADGSTVLWFAPEQPAEAGIGNWVQTDASRSWFAILRFYSPTPAFFDKKWRPGEIEVTD